MDFRKSLACFHELQPSRKYCLKNLGGAQQGWWSPARGGGAPCGWWCMSLIPILGRQRQADLQLKVQPGLQHEFQDRQGYTEKPCLENPNQIKKRVNKCCLTLAERTPILGGSVQSEVGLVFVYNHVLFERMSTLY